MKILMLTPYLPYPLYSGGQIRTYNLLKNLASRHEITLYSFIRKESEVKYIPKLKNFCKKIKVYKRRPAWDIRNILFAAFMPYPFVIITTYLSHKFKRSVSKELKNNNYDLIHAEPFYMMPNIPITKIPILLVEQTIEYLVYKKYVDNYKISIFKPFMYFDVLKLKFWEEHYWKKATNLVAMSWEDKMIMKKVVKKKNIDIVANGVDIDFFNKTIIKRPARPTVLFVGNFKWLPNKDAAKYLTNDIWPIIKKQVPEARLMIIGRNPTAEIHSLANKKDIVVGDNIKDIRQAFGQATVLLAPIRNGRGTKYKVLEAMATKLPVVSTPLGVDGLEVSDYKEVLIAKDAQTLARKTIEILQNPKLGEQISKKAYALVIKKYNWQLNASNLDKIYMKLGKLK